MARLLHRSKKVVSLGCQKRRAVTSQGSTGEIRGRLFRSDRLEENKFYSKDTTFSNTFQQFMDIFFQLFLDENLLDRIFLKIFI